MSCSPTSKKLCTRESCTSCLPRSFATHPWAAKWSNRNELPVRQVHLNSNKPFWFDCTDCGHTLSLKPNNLASGQGCRYCNSRDLCADDDCEHCFANSMASHPMGASWSQRNELTARQVLRGSEMRCWFRCRDCQHEFQSVPYSIKNDKLCPFCSHQSLCNEDACKSCYDKSCASYPLMVEEWSPENDCTPRQVFLQSNRKYTFHCKKCKHIYDTKANQYYNCESCCPYCANQRLCCDESCLVCFQKSFAAHPKASCWSPRNDKNPREVFKGAEAKHWMICDTCQSEFHTKLYNVLTGYWCPFCKNKSEKKVLAFLRSEYTDDCKTQSRYDWCRYSKTGNVMPIDFELSSKKVLLEVDGIQHFQKVSNWSCPENVQEKDVEKIHKAILQEYVMIHLFQEEMWKDSYDWKKVLRDVIAGCVADPTPRCIFISQSPTRYETHIEKMDKTIRYEIINPQ